MIKFRSKKKHVVLHPRSRHNGLPVEQELIVASGHAETKYRGNINVSEDPRGLDVLLSMKVGRTCGTPRCPSDGIESLTWLF